MASTRGSRFDGQALVTGAAAGIGRATAERFAADGAHVIVTDVDREGGQETVTRITEAGTALSSESST